MSSAKKWTGILLMLTVISIIVVAVRLDWRKESGTDDRFAPDIVPKTVTFTDLNRFLESTEWKRSTPAPLVFIGIDGASWQFINPLIERGILPNLERIKREGAYGRLRSIPCYVSPPAWVTMLSGYLPEKTGVYTFGEWNRAEREFLSVNGDDVEVPRVWNVASFSGRKVGVFNVPMSYPPHPVNGVIVSGMMTPVEKGKPSVGVLVSGLDRERPPSEDYIQSYSPVRRTVTDDSLNVYFWSLHDTVNDGIKDYNKVSLAVINKTDSLYGDRGTRFYTFDIGDFSPWIRILAQKNEKIQDAWCKVAIVKTPDNRYDTRISPCFFQIEAQYTYPDTLANHLEGKFDFYTPTVFVDTELVPSFTQAAVSHASYFYDLDDWDLYLYVFTQSDNIHHLTGFSPTAVEVYRRIDRFIGNILDKMPENSTVIIASDHGFGRYEYGLDLNRLLGNLGLLTWHDNSKINYDASLVFCYIWHLYFNHELLTREELGQRGFEVPPADDPVDFFAKYLQKAKKTIQSPGGKTFSLELHRLPDGAVGNAPDMIVRGTYGDVIVNFLSLENPQATVFQKLEGNECWWHKRDGVFLVRGPDVQAGFNAGTRNIQDIAPTMLYVQGLPIAADMDGRVMLDIFERRLLVKNALFHVKNYSEIPKISSGMENERESMLKKLRSLGYIR